MHFLFDKILRSPRKKSNLPISESGTVMVSAGSETSNSRRNRRFLWWFETSEPFEEEESSLCSIMMQWQLEGVSLTLLVRDDFNVCLELDGGMVLLGREGDNRLRRRSIHFLQMGRKVMPMAISTGGRVPSEHKLRFYFMTPRGPLYLGVTDKELKASLKPSTHLFEAGCLILDQLRCGLEEGAN